MTKEPIKMRNYGRIIQDMVTVACTEEDAAKRQQMIIYIGQCMRQKNTIWNKDQDTSFERVKSDLAVLSNGRLDTSFPELEAELSKPLTKAKKK